MKVLQVCTEKHWRGGEQQLGYLLMESQKFPIETIVACRTNSAMETFCKANGIKHVSFKFRSGLDLFSAFRLQQMARENEIDVMHVHSSGAHNMGLFFNRSIPVVVSRKVVFKIKKLSRWKYMHPRVKKIICISDAVRRYMEDFTGSSERLVTVYDGIDLGKMQGLSGTFLQNYYSLPSGVRIVGVTAALTAEKDLFTFIDVAEIVLQELPDTYFVIAGDGPLRDELKKYIQQLRIENNVILTGFIQDGYKIIPELDVYLATSTQEGLGTSVLDAMAAKIPVISTTAGGLKELVQHQVTGLTAAPGDSKLLAAHVVKLLSEPVLVKKLVDQGFKHSQSFSKENMGMKTIEVYQSIIGTKDV